MISGGVRGQNARCDRSRHKAETALQVGFGGGPVFAGDAEPDAVAGGAVGHEVVVAEGAFVERAELAWRFGIAGFRGGS